MRKFKGTVQVRWAYVSRGMYGLDRGRRRRCWWWTASVTTVSNEADFAAIDALVRMQIDVPLVPVSRGTLIERGLSTERDSAVATNTEAGLGLLIYIAL